MKFKYKEKNFDIKRMGHSSVLIEFEDIKLAIDPFRLKTDFHDVDFIFITHEHFDHFSIDDIKKLSVETTQFIFPNSMKEKVKDFENVIFMKPGEIKELKFENNIMQIKAIPAYNTDKHFHQKIRNWLGYLIDIDGVKFYHTGDSDFIEEMKNIKTDFLFVPVSGKYVMTSQEAAKLCEYIKPEYAIPIHYGEIIGDINNAQDLKTIYPKTLILEDEHF